MRDVRKIASGIANAGQPLYDVATAGQPEKEHLQRLTDAGYKTVVDLRTPEECPPPDEWGIAVRSAGLEYVNIPVGHEDIDDKTFDRFRQLMHNPECRPTLIHCASANRVGALLLPFLVRYGEASREAALQPSGMRRRRDGRGPQRRGAPVRS